MKTIVAVPESISREQYLTLIESVGFDAKHLLSLEFRVDGVYADVYEVAPDGQGHVLDATTDRPVINRVYIPVSDG